MKMIDETNLKAQSNQNNPLNNTNSFNQNNSNQNYNPNNNNLNNIFNQNNNNLNSFSNQNNFNNQNNNVQNNNNQNNILNNNNNNTTMKMGETQCKEKIARFFENRFRIANARKSWYKLQMKLKDKNEGLLEIVKKLKKNILLNKFNNNNNNQNNIFNNNSNQNNSFNNNQNNYDHNYENNHRYIEQSALKEEEEEEEEEMEIGDKRCSLKEHKELEAKVYCQECKIYMCNKCQNIHSSLCLNHHSFKLDKNIKEIFTGICKEKNHCNTLDYFCITHNQLCCSACLCKIKGKGNGFHNNCDVCFLKGIKKNKKDKLDENIKFLEDLSKTIEQSIIELKNLFENINDQKEKLKLDIQTIFTKIRSALNKREDELLSKVDEQYGNLFKEDLIKKSEEIPNKIKESLNKGYSINMGWDDKIKLCSLINECINIENNVLNINQIKKDIEDSNSNQNVEIKFNLQEDDINKFLETIINFGDILNNKNILYSKRDMNLYPFQ